MMILSLGSRGPVVEFLQSALNKANFRVGNVDGIFGSRTEDAVKRLQAYFGINVDGIVGPDTWEALFPFINGYAIYRVRSGDTLFKIAQNFTTSVNNILLANPDKDLSVIYPGQIIVVPFGNIVPTDISYTSEVLNINIRALKVVYPFIETGFIGTSVLSEDIPYVKIGNGEKEVFYNASFHANEWITSVVLMKFIENYCSAIRSGGTIYGFDARTLFDSVSIYIVPMVNPDGVNLVTGYIRDDSPAYLKARNIANNFPDIPFPSGWKANLNGVDLNLQYPAEWNRAKQIKFEQGFNKPAPRDYVGLGPLTEPEALAVYNFTLMHNFRLVISYHTQGKEIYWQFLNFTPPQGFEIANAFAEVSRLHCCRCTFCFKFCWL